MFSHGENEREQLANGREIRVFDISSLARENVKFLAIDESPGFFFFFIKKANAR